MGMNRTDYVIVGYNLMAFRKDILTNEFENSEEYERLTCNQRKGKIQLFIDPLRGKYLYLGYIVSDNDEYDNDTNIVTLNKMESEHPNVTHELNLLFDKRNEKDDLKLNYELICFSEWS